MKHLRKMFTAFIVAGAGAIVDAHFTTPGITGAEWLSALAIAVTAGVAVYIIPNTVNPPKPTNNE